MRDAVFDHPGGAEHPGRRSRRQYGIPSLRKLCWRAVQRVGFRVSGVVQVEDAASVVHSSGVDGDAWYATDYAYPNHWPQSDKGAAPLPLVKRRRVVRAYLRSLLDTELLLGLLLLAAVAYWFLTVSDAAPSPTPLTGL